MLLKPEEAAANLKKNRPGLADGLASFGLMNLAIGIAAFLVFTLVLLLFGSSIARLGNTALAGGIFALALSFGILVIAYPLSMLFMLLLITVFFKLASVILKGKGKFAEQCGLLGVVGSVYTAITILFMAVIYFPLILMVVVLGESMIGMALFYLCMGLGYVVFMPYSQMLTAFLFDLLADLEKLSIYRSGALAGLAFGIMMSLMMLALAAMLFLFGLFVPGLS